MDEHCPGCHHPDDDLCARTCPWGDEGFPPGVRQLLQDVVYWFSGYCENEAQEEVMERVKRGANE